MEPAAYLGITVAGFPQLLLHVSDPGTNLAFGGSLVFNGECQIRYTMECLKALLQSGKPLRWSALSRHVFADYQSALPRAAFAQLIWEHTPIKYTAIYQNEEGKVTLLWPWKIIDMWRWTKEVEPNDYRMY